MIGRYQDVIAFYCHGNKSLLSFGASVLLSRTRFLVILMFFRVKLKILNLEFLTKERFKLLLLRRVRIITYLSVHVHMRQAQSMPVRLTLEKKECTTIKE